MREPHVQRRRDAPLLPYRGGDPLSYTSGAYATLELLRARPERVRAVYLHPDCRDPEPLLAMCRAHGIPAHIGERAFAYINRRENAYVLGVFEKYPLRLSGRRHHVVLVRPEDEGNLGTIARTLAALGAYDLALIDPGADIWCPKAIRASMGAVFRLDFEVFPSIEDYLRRYPHRPIYPFMLDGAQALGARMRPMIAQPDENAARTATANARPGTDAMAGAMDDAHARGQSSWVGLHDAPVPVNNAPVSVPVNDAPKPEIDAQPPAKTAPFSLVFGPESTGLPPSYHELGMAIRIPQSGQVDSLNLAAAVAIAAFTFLP